MKFDIAQKLLTAGFYALTMVTVAGTAMAASDYPDAAASDPNTLGLMQGFPPAPDKRVMQPDSNFFSFPKLRWTVCHIRELMPTKQVSRGLGAPVPLEYALDDGIDAVTFTPMGGDKPMTWKEALAANYTDGMLVMHKGKIVYEHYTGCLAQAGKHAAMSMTKSMTGLLAEILVAEGTLDDKVPVATIIPELAGSAFADATVRQVMDMTTGLAYSEDYANPKADIWVYSAAANPMPKPADYKGPVGYYEYLQTVKKAGEHGEAFGYKTINSDALGWIVSRVSGRSVMRAVIAALSPPRRRGRRRRGPRPDDRRSARPSRRDSIPRSVRLRAAARRREDRAAGRSRWRHPHRPPSAPRPPAARGSRP